MATLTPKQKLERAHVSLVRSPSFAMLAGILMLGDSKVLSDEQYTHKYPGQPKTALTNGRDKYFHEDFVKELPQKQLAFLVAHESFHVLYKQILTWRPLWQRNPQAANMAMDFVINLVIQDLDPDEKVVQFIPGGCLDKKYKNWSTQQVFDDLMKDAQKSGGGKGQGQPGGGEPIDGHDFVDAQNLDEQERKDLEQAIDQAIRQGDILAGKMAGKSPRDFGLIPEPQVDWRKQLQDFITNICAGRDISTWRKPSRRWLAHDFYMPSAYSESVGRIVVACDTSASMSTDEIQACLAEVQSVADMVTPEDITLLYWDTEIQAEEVYTPDQFDQLLDSTKPAGFGGTEPHCVQYWLTQQQNQPEVIIMLTDGGIMDWPQFNSPTLWVITSDHTTAPHGKTIQLEL